MPKTETTPSAAPDARPPASPLLTAPILPTLVKLAWPNMAAMLATALVAMAETGYVGLLGTTPLAGLALVLPMLMMQQQMSAGAMGGGVSSALSRALGSGEPARASEVARHAVVVGLLAGLGFSALFLGLGGPIYRLLGASEQALAEALSYSNVAFLGSVGVWLTNTFASIVRGTGNMRLPSLALFVAAGLQIVLAGVLGLGLGPIPRFGMAGIAAGQVLAFGACAAFLLWFLGTGRARVALKLRGAPLSWNLFRDILKVGAIACLSSLQSVLSVIVLTGLVARFGTETLAGYGIGARLEFLLVPITSAIGIASVPMVGMAIGAGNVARARRIAWTGGAMAACVIGAIGVFVALAPDVWGRLFSADTTVLATARSYFAWAGPCYTFFGLGMCLYFASQGSGRILGPVLAQSVRLLVIVVGGWALTIANAPQWTLFALVGFAMICYGLAAALAVVVTRWGNTA